MRMRQLVNTAQVELFPRAATSVVAADSGRHFEAAAASDGARRIIGTNTYSDAGVLCRSCQSSIRPGQSLVTLIYDNNENGCGPALCPSCDAADQGLTPIRDSQEAHESLSYDEFLSDIGMPREDRGSLTRRARIARSYETQVDELVRIGVHEDDIDEAIAAMDVLMHYEESRP